MNRTNFRSTSQSRVVKRTNKVVITNFFMLDPIKSRRRYFFHASGLWVFFLLKCLSCVCFWHLFWQFSLGEKGLSAWEISISTKSCQTWAQQGNPSSFFSFCKIRISVWWVFTYVLFYAKAGLAKASAADPNCVFAQGKLHVILLLTGRKWENCFLHSIFFPVKKGKGSSRKENLWLKLSNTT